MLTNILQFNLKMLTNILQFNLKMLTKNLGSKDIS